MPDKGLIGRLFSLIGPGLDYICRVLAYFFEVVYMECGICLLYCTSRPSSIPSPIYPHSATFSLLYRPHSRFSVTPSRRFALYPSSPLSTDISIPNTSNPLLCWHRTHTCIRTRRRRRCGPVITPCTLFGSVPRANMSYKKKIPYQQTCSTV